MDNNQNTPVIDFDHGQPVKQPEPPKKRHVYSWLKYQHSKLTKKQKILVSIGIVLLVVVGGVASYLVYKNLHKAPPSNSSQPAPPKTTEPSKLTGVEVPIELNQRPVTGVMIENSLAARPQSGLRNAGIVFEAIAEGGITRFLALYQEGMPQDIGPIRSVRPYYLDWLMPFDASIAHVGGAPAALKDIKRFNIRDLDQFANPSAYKRISQRASPHNVHSSMARLDKLNAAKGFKSSSFVGFERKRKENPTSKPVARTINLAISSFYYNVKYTYNKANNSYLRSEGGTAHKDRKTSKRLAPKVVVALVMSRGIASDGQHTKYGTVGIGHAYIFQDGKVIKGRWKKSSRKARLLLTKAGKYIQLNPGQTWISIVDKSSSIKYKP